MIILAHSAYRYTSTFWNIYTVLEYLHSLEISLNLNTIIQFHLVHIRNMLCILMYKMNKQCLRTSCLFSLCIVQIEIFILYTFSYFLRTMGQVQKY